MRRVLLWTLRYVGSSLALYGQVYAPLVPPPYFAEPPRERPTVQLAGPPPGHPERLRPDLPLTPTERDLVRRLG